MIRYALACVGDHEFEAWFSNSEAYDVQRKKRQVACPTCGSTRVRKQIMAPSVRTSEAREANDMTPEAMAARVAGDVRKHISENFVYVGDKFADEARAMHSGEKPDKPLWGQVSPDVARELADEGVPAMPLPAPFAPEPPKPKNKMN